MKLSGELVEMALGGSRAARAKIASVQQSLAAVPASAAARQSLADSVGFLYESEITRDERLLDSLQLGLSRLSEAMRQLQDTSLTADARVEGCQADLAMALATLYPPTCTLEGILRPEEAAIPRESAPPKRPSLEIIPEDEERRAEARLRIETDIGLQSGHTFFSGKTGDISSGGLFLLTDDAHEIGTEVTLSFVLPSGYQVTTLGIVRWTESKSDGRGGIGIAFEGLHAADRDALSAFLGQHPASRRS